MRWITLHELDGGEWREITVQSVAIFAIGGPPRGWDAGAVVYPAGSRVLIVRETREEIIALAGRPIMVDR
jgi:hypothetical protein